MVLWVTAGVMVAIAVARSVETMREVSPKPVETVLAPQPWSFQSTVADAHGVAAAADDDRESDPSGRTLFRIASSVPLAVPLEPESTTPAMPMLRGIIEQRGEKRAVFAAADGRPGYAVIGVGESFGGYDVVSIEQDQLSATTSRGEAVILKLRGVGELP